MVAGAFVLTEWFTALSVAMGAALAVANFAYMGRTIRTSLLPGGPNGAMARMLVRYYIRFVITAAVLWILIWRGWAEPLGLLVGLGVVVTSLIIWGLFQARRN